jgi:hypothetical protein
MVPYFQKGNLMMRPLSRRLGFFALLSAFAVLPACGGGNDDLPPEVPVEEVAPEPEVEEAAQAPTVDVVSKYVGAWASECFTEDEFSAVVRADFAKSSATRFTGNVVVNAYLGTSCSGPVVQSERVLTNLALSYDGTKRIGSATAEKFAGKADQGTGKVLLYLRGSTLRIGDPGASRDAQGYPNAFYDKTLTRL